MRIFDPIQEPWARLIAALIPCGFGGASLFFLPPLFGIGLASGGLIAVIMHWAARLDEHALWLGRKEEPPDEDDF